MAAECIRRVGPPAQRSGHRLGSVNLQPRRFGMCFTRRKVAPLLKKSVKALLEQQDSQGSWSFPAHLGSHYISLYALFLEWLRFRGFSSRLDLNRLAGILQQSQLPDGSWRQARDPALPSGDINATVLNYAALKFFRTGAGYHVRRRRRRTERRSIVRSSSFRKRPTLFGTIPSAPCLHGGKRSRSKARRTMRTCG